MRDAPFHIYPKAETVKGVYAITALDLSKTRPEKLDLFTFRLQPA